MTKRPKAQAVLMAPTAPLVLVAVVTLGVSCAGFEWHLSCDFTKKVQTGPLSTPNNPRAVYGADLNDPWNRIFRLLFTRTIEARVSEDFAEGAPFVQFRDPIRLRNLRASSRLIKQNEIGDRAIDPLYPSFLTNVGVLEVLREPKYSELSKALNDSLAETAARRPLARALMQSDVWAAYDVLFSRQRFSSRLEAELGKKRDQLLFLLARFIRKLALTQKEISSLGANYERESRLPNLFSPNSGWIEIQLLPHRLHDYSCAFRRVTRVFVKSRKPSTGAFEFAESLKGNQDVAKKAAGVALVVQNLLIDSNDRVVLSPITSAVQIRDFSDGVTVREYELSRRLLLTDSSSGGFVEHDDRSPSYATNAGNDYDFATPITPQAAAIVVRLKTRCSACHGRSLAILMTYSLHDPPELQPPVTLLDPLKNDRARYTADEKEKRDDFKTLLRHANKDH